MAKAQKKGKKVWVKINAGPEFNNIELGESYVHSPEDLMGKKFKINLSMLTGDMRKQNSNITFKIN